MATQFSRRRMLAGVFGGALGLAAPAWLVSGNVPTGQSAPQQTGRTGAKHQWAMVIDLRKCEGCVTTGDPPLCTEGCNLEHSVPPGQEWIRIVEQVDEGGNTYFMPLLCQQCEDAPCVNVCPVGATYHDSEGVVLIDHEKCIGCRMCMAACPYGARSFNWEQPPNPPEAAFGTYSPQYPVPHRKGTVNKCMLCAHHLEDGKLPACAKGCPMFAIYLADLNSDLATNGQEVVQLSRFLSENNAFQLRASLGTGPRVWYLPGHGQEYGRPLDDDRPLTPARTWLELRELEEERAEEADEAVHGHDGEDEAEGGEE
jgi:dimethyl sulfoxide reductase iron-sulfur subunit